MWINNTYINAKQVVTVGPYTTPLGEYGLLINGVKYKVGSDRSICKGDSSKVIKRLMDVYIVDLVKEIENG